MNNLLRYLLKTISTACLWIVIFTAALSSAYAFDKDRIDLTITRFLDSLSYKYKGFDIKITQVSIGETFDDNILFIKENKIEDFITEARIGLGILYEGKTRNLGLTANITNQTFAENDVFNNVAQDVNLNFSNEFSKYSRISFNNIFRHTEAPLFSSEDFFESQLGRPSGRFDYFNNKFNINYSYDVAKQFVVITKYTNEINAYSGTNIPASATNKPGVEVDYLSTFGPTFLFLYDFANVQFDNGEDATINTIASGIRQYITQKISFDVKAGLDFIDSFDDEKLTRPRIQTTLIYQKDSDTIANLSFDKKQGTNPYAADVFDSWAISTSLTRQLLERLRTTLSLFYSESEFLPSDFEQRFFGGSSTFTYDISKNLKGTLTYTYSQSNTNVETAGYTKNTIFLGFSAGF